VVPLKNPIQRLAARVLKYEDRPLFVTINGQRLEGNVRRFESKPIKVRHFIYARRKRGRQ
jgi:hypothetical protein